MKLLKFIALLLALLMIAAIFVGCNIGNDPQGSSNESSSETEKSTKKPYTKITSPSTGSSTKYDDEAPQNPAQLPLYNGKDFSYTDIYLGQESEMHVVTDTNDAEYKAYLTELETAGYEFYTENTLGDNLFATYTDDTHIINVMYIPAFSQVRVIVDERSIFSLPGLEADNVYEDTTEPALILLSDDEITWPGRMGYIYQLADGSFFIMDGGWGDYNPKLSTAPLVMSVLQEYAPDPENIKIAAWFISHQHTDHYGAMFDIARNEEYRSKIHVEKIIYNMPSEKDLSTQDKESRYDSGNIESGIKLSEAIKNLNPDQQIKAHPGQIFYIRNLKFTIYHSHDLLLYAPLSGTSTSLMKGISTHNDTSIVTKVEFEGKTALYMADCSYTANKTVVGPVYKNALEADILQVAHHGYGDTGADNVYQYISPEMVFWPVYRYHYYASESYPGGVSTIGLNGSLFKEGIKHFIFENDICIVIDNFETWEGREWDALPNE